MWWEVLCRCFTFTFSVLIYIYTSLAGLLAARVCHNYFKRVIIIEPESWLATEEARITEAWTQRHDRSRVIQYHSVQGKVYIKRLTGSRNIYGTNIFF